MSKPGPDAGRRARAFAYWLVTTGIVLVFALCEWAAESYVSGKSRAAGTTLEVAIILVAAIVFRPVHQRVEAAVDAAFFKRKRQALAALARFRNELSSFSDVQQLLRRVIEAVEHHLEASACAVYVRRDSFQAEASSFDAAAAQVSLDDPLAIRLRSSGAPARPPLLDSTACGTHAFPMTAGGELVGFVSVHCRHGDFEADELRMLTGLAQDLAVALVALDPTLRRRKETVPNNLPSDLPQLIGRAREIGEIKQALAQSRLVTLTGTGGVGKTRLALQCAAELLSRHEHGAWFVDLAPIANAASVAPAILAALNAGDADLIEYLRERDALLVIDNCEHVVVQAADIIAEIRAKCTHIAIMATSRELLHLESEHVYRVGPLRPDAAVDLFVKRACAVSPEFTSGESKDSIRGICERLDGIPLAIELAAARVRALSVEEIGARLDERFRLLNGATRTALPRQQTLRALIEWSYDLLAPEDQSFFRRLFVFRGSFSLAAAAAVCASGGSCDEYHVLDVLTSLADKSLLTVNIALSTRYRLLETIREFCAQKAAEHGDAGAAQRHHAEHYAALAAQAYHEFDSRLPQGWLERLEPDVDNFRSALAWAFEHGGDLAGAQFAADCGPIFLRMGLLAEGLRWCEMARGVAGLAPAISGRIEYVASMLHNNAGNYDRALECAVPAARYYAASTDERGSIRALAQVAQQYAQTGRPDEAEVPAQEALARARALGEPRVLMSVLRRTASALPRERIREARPLFEEALQLARANDDAEETCLVLQWWAIREAAAGNYDTAIDLARTALEAPSGRVRMYLESQIACYALACGRLADAEPHARNVLSLSTDANHPLLSAIAIVCCAPFHARRDAQEAAMLLGYAQSRLRDLKWKVDGELLLALDNASEIVRRELGPEEMPPLVDRGAALTQGDALNMLSVT
jgi:predicted ATPase